ncbi:MAG: hypothetical protein SGARI_005758 [Bacillariaceae sp.]
MLNHPCGKTMVQNLTLILKMIEEGLLQEVQQQQIADGSDDKKESSSAAVDAVTSNNGNNNNFHRVYLCISRRFMEMNTGSWYSRKKELADDNLNTLNRVTVTAAATTSKGRGNGSSGNGSSGGMWNSTVPVVEGGETLMESSLKGLFTIQEAGMAAQVVNFFVAVHADVFVGTYGSSYSTDVWTVRHYLGKGDRNYRHSPQGLFKVEGLPPPHQKCGRKSK